MIFKFLSKQKELKKKKKLMEIMIVSLNIPEEQKQLYLEALNTMWEDYLEALYKNLVSFTERVELKEIESINKESFSTIAWMRKKEAVEKQKEINSFSFLISNL